MSDELKPCPFCGGENVTNEFDDPFYSVICGICGASSAFSDEEGAVRLWNARAAVTDEQFAMAVHDGEAWQQVRECRNVGEETDDDFKCSLCGASYNESDDMAMPASRIDWCFSCGAKVAG